jgi:hypothetical protein
VLHGAVGQSGPRLVDIRRIRRAVGWGKPGDCGDRHDDENRELRHARDSFTDG